MRERTGIAPLKERQLLESENKLKAPRRSAMSHPVIAISVILFLVLVALTIIGGYFLHWSWTGFNSGPAFTKTLWDWLQLLVIPAVLAIVGYAINHTISSHQKTERETALDNYREDVLQIYIDKLSELLLHEHLRESQGEHEVRKIAQVRTLTVLPRLNNTRKRSVILFLQRSHLINKGRPIVNLRGAYLSRADLSKADLSGVDLVRTDLSEADLSRANLVRTDLSEADLSRAILRGADLSEADLSRAILRGADLSEADLSRAILRGADLSEADLSRATVTQEQLMAAGSSEGIVRPGQLSRVESRELVGPSWEE